MNKFLNADNCLSFFFPANNAYKHIFLFTFFLKLKHAPDWHQLQSCADFWLSWKEMFCLTTHSTHFIYGYMVSTCKGPLGEKNHAVTTWATLSE